MVWLFESIRDLRDELVARRRYGVITAREGRFESLQFRPYPTSASRAQAWLDRRLRCWRRAENVCRLYYNAPRSAPGFLSLTYLVSSRGTTLATIQAALAALDEIARTRRSDAIVCDASNQRLSEAILARYGFERHARSLPGRHFIKRFEHPPQYEWLRRPPAEIFADVLSEQGTAIGEVLHT